jgi:F420-non-reducing hydrogenase iron-sulfur subunit
MSEAFEPKVLVFSCNWCSYTAADLAGTSRLQIHPDVTVIRVMCSGRVEPVLILSALTAGFDGVMVTGCHPGDCHYLTGNARARERMDFLEALLAHFGLDNRVEMNYVSASEGILFAQVTADYQRRIAALGPSPLRGLDLPALADKRGRFHQLLTGIRDRLDLSFDEELKLAIDQVIAGFGHPVYDLDKCIGCGACAQMCPSSNIEMVDADGQRRISFFHTTCTTCRTCEEICPVEAIEVVREFDIHSFLSRERFAASELPLQTCRGCGESYSTEKQLAHLLGSEELSDKELEHLDLCPRCRRTEAARVMRTEFRPETVLSRGAKS